MAPVRPNPIGPGRPDVYHVRGRLLGKGVAVAVRYCIGCGQEFEQRARFCSNCGTARPLPSRPKAKPAPTSTPEAILASLEEAAREQPAEAPWADSPEPVREARRVTPPQQEQAAESGPEARRREDMRYAVGGGLLLGVAIAFFGIVGGAPWWGVLPVAGFLGLAFWGHVYQERPKRRGERAPFRNSSRRSASTTSAFPPRGGATATARSARAPRCGPSRPSPTSSTSPPTKASTR